MTVDTSKHSWLCSTEYLVRKIEGIEIKGAKIMLGKVGIAVTVFDDNKEAQFNLGKVAISANGDQLAGTKIRGSIVNMMGKEHLSGGLCAYDK